MMPSET